MSAATVKKTFKLVKYWKLSMEMGLNCVGKIASVHNFFNASKHFTSKHFTQVDQHDFVNNKSLKTCSNLCHQMGRSTG